MKLIRFRRRAAHKWEIAGNETELRQKLAGEQAEVIMPAKPWPIRLWRKFFPLKGTPAIVGDGVHTTTINRGGPSPTLRNQRQLPAKHPSPTPTLPARGLTTNPQHPKVKPYTGPEKLGTPQNEVYLVLSEEERAKGFVRKVRRTYIHVGRLPVMEGIVLIKPGHNAQVSRVCGTRTTMGIALAETYARSPKFYGATYCCGCQAHFPVDEFIWEGTTEKVGS